MAQGRGELTVLVVRSGGVAGIPRRWSVEEPEPGDDWIALIDACPWDAVGADERDRQTARDRFIWRIEASMADRRRQASVPESELTGPWRSLVERVQSEG
ncbi:protealysin inhibitor emfourin, partial [Mesorhizobium japonicum]|uniref:protealysin inhibitor emfourin n=1 Tax=Mesorhizobium japonicum TaxID=2066070 RepID=UPI003B5C64BF